MNEFKITATSMETFLLLLKYQIDLIDLLLCIVQVYYLKIINTFTIDYFVFGDFNAHHTSKMNFINFGLPMELDLTPIMLSTACFVTLLNSKFG